LLTERLRELETEGIVARVVHGGRPVRVIYELTPCGHSLEPVIRSVSDWAETWVR
jgi:DNA-binding HxlR family transcriptional regulator